VTGRTPERAGSVRCPACGAQFHAEPANAVGPPVAPSERHFEPIPRDASGFGLLSVVVIAGVALWIGLTVGGLSGYLVGSGFITAKVQATGTAKAPGVPVAVVSATDLDREYEANLAAAEVKYAGKLIEVTGMRPKLDKDARERYFLASSQRLVRQNQPARITSIEGARAALQEAALNAQYVPGMYFYIRPSELPRFADPKGEQTYRIRGICRGLTRRDDLQPNFIVILEDCTLVETKGLPATPALNGKR
jgi:hypothetical protein